MCDREYKDEWLRANIQHVLSIEKVCLEYFKYQSQSLLSIVRNRVLCKNICTEKVSYILLQIVIPNCYSSYLSYYQIEQKYKKISHNNLSVT